MLSSSTSNVVLSLPNPKQLEDGEFDLDELVEKFMGLLAEDSKRNEILQLTGDTAVLVIECLDKVISSDAFRTIPDVQARSKVFSTVSRLSRNIQYLPHSYWIDPNTISLPNEPYASGTCAEVYRGMHEGEYVAVKVLRTSHQEKATTLRKRFCREVIVWKHVSCPYVLKFNGVFYHNEVPAIVTPWMPHGNITEYLETRPDVDRLRLFLGAVKGVRYLHSCNIAHGDIKGQNILISDSDPPKAILADFGFTRVTGPSLKTLTEESGTVSFMAPELLHSARFGLEKGVPSKEADIYALGMTVYQVLTGQWPFYPKREAEVVLAVISGKRPPKPENAEEIGMTEVVWELMEDCWREDRTERPDILRVLKRFSIITEEKQTAGLAIEVMPMPRPGVAGDYISVTSENSYAITVSWKLIRCVTTALHSYTDERSSLSIATTDLSIPFYCFEPEEITEVKGKNPTKDHNVTKESRLVTRTGHQTEADLVIKKPGIGRASIVGGPPSPTEALGCCINDARAGYKRKYLWTRVKQLTLRSMDL